MENFCTACGTECSSDEQFCSSCGKERETYSDLDHPTCQNCGTAVDPDASFCPDCGDELSNDADYCFRCGELIEGDETYCPYCGQHLDATGRHGTPGQHSQRTPGTFRGWVAATGRRRIALYILILLWLELMLYLSTKPLLPCTAQHCTPLIIKEPVIVTGVTVAGLAVAYAASFVLAAVWTTIDDILFRER